MFKTFPNVLQTNLHYLYKYITEIGTNGKGHPRRGQNKS